MTITLSELAALMPRNSKSYCPLTDSDFRSLRPVEDMKYGEMVPAHCLYYGDFSSVRSVRDLKNCTLILYSGRPVTFRTADLSCNLLIFFDSGEFRAFIDMIREKLEEQILLSDISEKCLEILKKSDNCQPLLEYAYSLLNNPILFVDVTFNYIASVGAENTGREPIWDFTLENGYMPNDYLEALFDPMKSSHSSSEDEILLLEENAGKYLKHYQIAAKVSDQYMITGYLKLLEINRKITDFDRSVLILFSRFLSVLETGSRREEDASIVDTFVRSVFAGIYRSREDLRGKRAALGVKFYDYLQVITIERKDHSQYEEDRVAFLLKKIKKFFERHHVVLLDNYFVILYDTKDGDQGRKLGQNEEFLSFLEEYECQANFSYPFRDLFDTPQFYQQTLFCISLRDLFVENRPVLFYEDIIEYHMLIHFSGMTNLDFLIHPIVRRLQEIDRENSSNYLETLFTYIRHSQDLSQTAQAMFVHYNTLRYRISRIVEFTDIDFSNARTIFLISISERILNIQDMQKYQKKIPLEEVAKQPDHS